MDTAILTGGVGAIPLLAIGEIGFAILFVALCAVSVLMLRHLKWRRRSESGP
jgi:hypothetical protein